MEGEDIVHLVTFFEEQEHHHRPALTYIPPLTLAHPSYYPVQFDIFKLILFIFLYGYIPPPLISLAHPLAVGLLSVSLNVPPSFPGSGPQPGRLVMAPFLVPGSLVPPIWL